MEKRALWKLWQEAKRNLQYAQTYNYYRLEREAIEAYGRVADAAEAAGCYRHSVYIDAWVHSGGMT